jgi:4-diphosphocytidyl-2-C-methyl-D-erythritol kinase
MFVLEKVASHRKVTLFSPAKLNLFFRILNKRSDGYHEIASLYQAIDFGDTLTAIASDCDTMSCSDMSLPLDSTNLVLKAADLFRRKTQIRAYAHFNLQKCIPVGLGLGGGSGNAASTLWALNELYERPATNSELMTWAGEIGSDAAFFFSKGTAFCRGRGEIIEEVSLDLDPPFQLAFPDFGNATPDVYRRVDLAETSDLDPLELLASFQAGDPHYINDLEPAAFKLRPELKILKEKLYTLGFHTVCMTGSGSAFFCFPYLKNPSLEGITFLPSHFLNRKEGAWYVK